MNKFVLRAVTAVLMLLLGACGFGASEQERMQKAAEFEQKNELRSAIIELKNVLQDNPDNGQARFMLGRISLATGDPAAAEKELMRARSIGVQSDELSLHLAEALLAQSKFSEMLTALDAASLKPANRAAGLVLQAYANLGQNDLELAHERFEEVLQIAMGNAEALNGLALVARAQGDLKQALDFLARAAASDADNVQTGLIRGEIELAQGRYEAAKSAFSQVVEASDGQLTGRAFSALVGTARADWRLGNAAAAAASLDKLIKALPNHPTPLLLRAQIAAAGGDLDLAETHLLNVLKYDSSNRQASYLLGAVHYGQGKLEQANTRLSNYVAAVPSDQRARKLLASTLARLERPRDAMDALNPVLAANQSDSEAVLMMASLSFGEGQADSAVKLLEQHASQRPSDRDSQFRLAAGYLQADQAQSAINVLLDMPDVRDPRFRKEVLLLSAYLQAEQQAKATALADRLARDNPSSINAQLVSGNFFLSVGETERARANFERALEIKSDDPAALENMAKFEFHLGRRAEAKNLLERVLVIQPDNVKAAEALAQIALDSNDLDAALNLLERLWAAGHRSDYAGLQLVKLYLAQKQPEPAAEVADEMQRSDPDSASTSYASGLVNLAKGDLKRAVVLLNEASARNPRAIEYQTTLGRAYYLNGQLGEARSALEQALYLQETHLPALELLAEIELREGRPAKAYEYAKRAQTSMPDSAAGYALEGNLALARKEYERAAKAFERALSLDARVVWLVRQYEAVDAYDKAQAQVVLKRWLGANPGDVQVRMLLGQTYLESGENNAAIAEYEKVIKSRPDHAAALNNLGWLYDAVGDPRAVSTAKMAYDLAPDSWQIADTYAWLLVKNSDFDKAIRVFETVIGEAAVTPEVKYHYAVALAGTGNQTQAKALLNEVLNSQASFMGIEDARRLLREIE